MRLLRAEVADIVGDLMDTQLKNRLADVPSMAVLVPVAKTKMQKWTPSMLLKDTYALHLLCEMPGHTHFVDASPYPVEFPKAFVKSCAPFLAKLLQVAKLLLSVSTLLPGMPSVTISDDMITGVAAMGEGGADGLDGLAEELEKAHAARKQVGDGCGALEVAGAMELRTEQAVQQLQWWVKQLDPTPHKYQTLVPCRHSSNDAQLWVCAEHKLELEACRAARKKASVKKDATKKAVVKDTAEAAASKQKEEKKKDTGKKSGKQKSAKIKKNQVVPMLSNVWRCTYV